MQHVLGTADVKSNIFSLDTEEKFQLLLETNDVLLDRAVSFPQEQFAIRTLFFLLSPPVYTYVHLYATPCVP